MRSDRLESPLFKHSMGRTSEGCSEPVPHSQHENITRIRPCWFRNRKSRKKRGQEREISWYQSRVQSNHKALEMMRNAAKRAQFSQSKLKLSGWLRARLRHSDLYLQFPFETVSAKVGTLTYDRQSTMPLIFLLVCYAFFSSFISFGLINIYTTLL